MKIQVQHHGRPLGMSVTDENGHPLPVSRVTVSLGVDLRPTAAIVVQLDKVDLKNIDGQFYGFINGVRYALLPCPQMQSANHAET